MKALTRVIYLCWLSPYFQVCWKENTEKRNKILAREEEKQFEAFYNVPYFKFYFSFSLLLSIQVITEANWGLRNSQKPTIADNFDLFLQIWLKWRRVPTITQYNLLKDLTGGASSAMHA